MNIVLTMIQISFSSIVKFVLIIFTQLLSFFFLKSFYSYFLKFLKFKLKCFILSCAKMMNILELNKTDMELVG